MCSFRKLYLGVFFLFVLVAAWGRHGFAVITIEPDFTGTLVITLPDGNIALLEEGDVVPEIPSNSLIEVFDGDFTVHTEIGDAVSVACGGTDNVVQGGNAATLRCDEDSGELLAPPTAEGNETGLPFVPGNPPDSRNIQASPVS